MSTARLACAAYIRTSTDDQQSSEDSRRWQLDIASRLVGSADGQIVAVYHDIDVTRELPWSRRPEASRLLRDAADPNRGWSALVIAEPQRAFSGGQFQLVFPQLTHFGVDTSIVEVDASMRVGNLSNHPRCPSRTPKGSVQPWRAPSGRVHVTGSAPRSGGCNRSSTSKTGVGVNRPPTVSAIS